MHQTLNATHERGKNMGRTTPAKGKHTSPSKVGVAFKNETLPKNTTPDEALPYLVDIYKKAKAKDKAYKGLWTEETFSDAVEGYFDYIAEHNIKPSKSSLQLWLGCGNTQYYDWSTKPEKFSYKTIILEQAHKVMEASYVNRGEKYPTFNTFLLKTSHGHVETSKLDVQTNSTFSADEDIKELIAKLGLDQQK